MSDWSDVIVLSDEESHSNKPEDDLVICSASSKINIQQRVEIKQSDYLRLEEWGIIKLLHIFYKNNFQYGFIVCLSNF